MHKLKSSVTIAAIALALVTATVVVLVSMMPVQSAHASCISSTNGKAFACSGGSIGCGTTSCSGTIGGPLAGAGPSGSFSSSAHQSTSGNFGHCVDTTCSGTK